MRYLNTKIKNHSYFFTTILSIVFFSFAIYPSISFADDVEFEWAKQMGGTLADNSRAVAVDPSGNVYTTGLFNGTADFDPSSSVYNMTSFGGNDIYVSKFDSSGNFVWAKQMGGTGTDQGQSITIDSAGNLLITGQFGSTADFDPSGAVYNLTSAGGQDVFIVKLDTNGNFIWAKGVGGVGATDNGRMLITDPTNNVYVGGLFSSTADFDPSGTVYNLTSAGGDDAYILKLDSSGNFVWAKQMGGAGTDRAITIAIDSNNNLYTAGYYTATGDFDPSQSVYNLNFIGATQNTFILKLDNNGNFVWAKGLSGTIDNNGYAIAVDLNNNVYITGAFSGTMDLDPGVDVTSVTSFGGNDIYVSKFDTTGNFIWGKQMGGTGDDATQSISVDVNGNVYFFGNFTLTADFDPEIGTANLTSFGNSDVFMSKLDTNGNFVWVKQIGGTGDDKGPFMTIDSSGNVYGTGNFAGTADFDPGIGTYNITSFGVGDIYIVKLIPTDTTKPIITLLGQSNISIRAGETYNDEGATASDDKDGDITSNIVTVNNVDTETPGTYTITYNVSDAALNQATEVTRTVNVNTKPSYGYYAKTQVTNIIPTIIITPPTTPTPIVVTPPKITKVLKYKMKDKEVKELQVFLNAHGYNCGIADGFFGPKTKASVILFQKANNLSADGIVGDMTRKKIQ